MTPYPNNWPSLHQRELLRAYVQGTSSFDGENHRRSILSGARLLGIDLKTPDAKDRLRELLDAMDREDTSSFPSLAPTPPAEEAMWQIQHRRNVQDICCVLHWSRKRVLSLLDQMRKQTGLKLVTEEGIDSGKFWKAHGVETPFGEK